jgi:hypothetical protein
MPVNTTKMFDNYANLINMCAVAKDKVGLTHIGAGLRLLAEDHDLRVRKAAKDALYLARCCYFAIDNPTATVRDIRKNVRPA